MPLHYYSGLHRRILISLLENERHLDFFPVLLEWPYSGLADSEQPRHFDKHYSYSKHCSEYHPRSSHNRAEIQNNSKEKSF